MASLSSGRLFGLEIALKKNNIHSDAETGCEPYVAGCLFRKGLCDTVRINAMVFSSIELPSRLLAA
jgi:hypothetical protein